MAADLVVRSLQLFLINAVVQHEYSHSVSVALTAEKLKIIVK
eukprot:XP_001708297.1 Hypothetical protein GL50803_24781 [Giardia lamblia ATCC 50803]